MSASSFGIGVVIGATVSSQFTSSMSVTQRSLIKISGLTDKMKKRQQALTDAARRYGNIGTGSISSLRNEYQLLNRTIQQLGKSQKALTDQLNRSKMLHEQRNGIYGQMGWFAAKATAAAQPFIKAGKTFGGEESQATSIAQGAGNFDPVFKQHLLDQARKTSMTTAQSSSAILNIMDTLTDAQWKQSDIDKVTTLIGRTATTYKQDVSVFTDTAETLAKTFGYNSDQMQHAFNLLAKGGNTVGFEFPDIAPALGELGQLIKTCVWK